MAKKENKLTRARKAVAKPGRKTSSTQRKSTRPENALTRARKAAKPASAKKKDPRPARPSSQIKATMKKERAAEKKASGKKSDWFSKLSPAAQKAYIKSHPNSKYAKGGKKVAAKPTAKAAPKATVKKVSKTVVKPIIGISGRTAVGNAMDKVFAHQDKLQATKERHSVAKTPAAKQKLKEKMKKHRANITLAKQKLKDATRAEKQRNKKAVAKPTRKKYASDKLNAKNAKRLARDVTTTTGAKKRPKPMKVPTAKRSAKTAFLKRLKK